MTNSNKTLIYITFGGLPATLFGMPSLLLLVNPNIEVVLLPLSIIVATAGLWMASFDTSSNYSKKRFLIIGFLILGLVLMLPITFSFIFVSFTETDRYLIDNIRMTYFTVGPVLIAAHYIITSIINMASNKPFNSDGANNAPPG